MYEVVFMAVKYDKLFHALINKKISNAQLEEKVGVSANIITRLKENSMSQWKALKNLPRFKLWY